MVTNPTRRSVLGTVIVGIATVPGCLDYLPTGCEDGSKYILILTEVEPDAVRIDPIPSENLTTNERRLVEKALDGGRYETCPQDVSESESRAFYDFGDRVQSRSQEGYAYLQFHGRDYQIGLVLSAVYYARTEHEPTEMADSTP